MNKYLKLLISVFLFITLIKTDGLAGNLSEEADIFDDIKAEMISSSQENKRLATQNKMLKAQLISLQLEIEQYEQEIGQLDSEYMEAREAAKKQKKGSAGRDPQDDDLIQEAQDIYLSGQSMLLDDVQRLRELQLYELQYQKQELELDRKTMESLNRRISGQRRPEEEALEREIEENAAKTRNISMKIMEEEKAALLYPREIDLLKMENKALKEKISQLKKLLK